MKRYAYEWSQNRSCYFVYDRLRGTEPTWLNAMCSCSKRADAEAIVDALNAAVA